MFKPLVLLLALAACAPQGLQNTTPQDRIILSNRGSIEGGHSLIITPDDRVVYDAYGTDIAPATAGWQWQDPSHVTGQASVAAPGAYARARALIHRATRENQPNSAAPTAPACRNAEQGTIILVSGASTIFERVAANCLRLSPEGSSQAAYLAAFRALNATLRSAILPAGWLQL